MSLVKRKIFICDHCGAIKLLNDMIAALAIRYRMDGVNLVETICARVATQRGET